MYRVQIIEYPEFETYTAWDDRPLYRNGPDRHWSECRRPVGWEPAADYIEHFKTTKFFEPDTDRWWRSRSSAGDRARLLNNMGYVAIVQRSAPVRWPADGEKKVDVSDNARVAAAVRTLVRAGVLRISDGKVGAA